MRELGINLICANSPKAKGRVEKANRTPQDRLVKGRAIGYNTLDKKHRQTPVSTEKEIESFKLGLQNNSPSKDHP